MSTSARPPAVLVIGAGGNFGPYIVHELLRQKARFRRIAILSTLQKKEKFSSAAAKGIDVVVGDYKDAKSYKGISQKERAKTITDMLTVKRNTNHRFRHSHFSGWQRNHDRSTTND